MQSQHHIHKKVFVVFHLSEVARCLIKFILLYYAIQILYTEAENTLLIAFAKNSTKLIF